MRGKPAYAAAAVHYFDGSHRTRDDEPKTPCSKIYGEKRIEAAEQKLRLTDNLEEVTCPRCFRLVERGRDGPEPDRSWTEVGKTPRKKKPLKKRVRRRLRVERRRATREWLSRKKKMLIGALAFLALRRRL